MYINLRNPSYWAVETKNIFSMDSEKERGRMHGAVEGGKGKIVSPNKGIYLFSLSLCVVLELAIYSPLNFISDFVEW